MLLFINSVFSDGTSGESSFLAFQVFHFLPIIPLRWRPCTAAHRPQPALLTTHLCAQWAQLTRGAIREARASLSQNRVGTGQVSIPRRSSCGHCCLSAGPLHLPVTGSPGCGGLPGWGLAPMTSCSPQSQSVKSALFPDPQMQEPKGQALQP